MNKSGVIIGSASNLLTMQLGSLTVEILSEGRFELFKDGHINRSPQKLQKAGRSEKNHRSTEGSVLVGINPILVKSGRNNILLDTGLGWGLDSGSKYTDVSNIRTNLDIFGLRPDDITHVILTHLHYDHAAGSSFTDADAKTRATFPNATYFAHQQEWEYALTQIDANQDWVGANYKLDDFYRLVSDNRMHFLSGNATEILKGITVIKTGGHTPGHQIVQLESEGEKAYYLGDLLPTTFHLNHYAMSGADIHTLEAKKRKVQLLKKACNENALLLFYHSKKGQAGRLFRDKDKQYMLAKQLP